MASSSDAAELPGPPSPEMLATEKQLGVIRPIVAYMDK